MIYVIFALNFNFVRNLILDAPQCALTTAHKTYVVLLLWARRINTTYLSLHAHCGGQTSLCSLCSVVCNVFQNVWSVGRCPVKIMLSARSNLSRFFFSPLDKCSFSVSSNQISNRYIHSERYYSQVCTVK